MVPRIWLDWNSWLVGVNYWPAEISMYDLATKETLRAWFVAIHLGPVVVEFGN